MQEYDSLFEQNYRDNYDKLFNVAFRITGNFSDTEDVLQETFFNAYKAYPGFNGNSLFTTWIYRILVNCSIKFIKKRKILPAEIISQNHNSTEEDILDNLRSRDSVADEVAAASIREYCLQMFLNCMPGKQRIAFTLKVLLDLSVHESALIMNISESAVKTNIFRARHLMRENMEGRCSLINAKNKCECRLWAKYAAENDLAENISRYSFKKAAAQTLEYSELIHEITFMGKIIALYRDRMQAADDPKAFIEKMRKIILQKDIKILS